MTVSIGRRAMIIVGASMLTLTAPAAAQESSPSSAAPEGSAVATEADGHMARILDAGVIRMSTDPAYPPQSELVDGVIVGFDTDVGTEIATRLGVDITFETPDWALVSAGGWSDRWDFSVGSMTITSAREKILDPRRCASSRRPSATSSSP